MPDFFHSNLKQGLFDSSNQIMIIEKGLFRYNMEIKGGKTTIQKASFALDPKVCLVVKKNSHNRVDIHAVWASD